MANLSPTPPTPPMSATFLFLLLLTTAATSITSATSTTTTTTYQEHETMLETLRTHGHTLFTNAITTSDLQYQLLTTNTATSTTSDTAAAASDGTTDSTSPFTLFAPRDTLLFSLDMTSDAAAYVDTLRYHVIPYHRHTFADLQNLSSPFLDTLLPHYSVLIGKTRDGDVSLENATVGVIVDGVRVSHPDLFIGSRIAVHGIDGILVTGLNMNQYFDGTDTGIGIFDSPAESPAALSGIDVNIPVEGPVSPTSQFDWNNDIPVNSPVSPFDWNIPAEEALTPMSQFDWSNNIPVAPMSPFDRNTPVAAPPQILQDQPEKVKKQRKRRRSGRGHRKHKRSHGHGHRLDDL